ncbi:MAG: M14 family metallocarboxypeptidase [Clostridia bacterium]|nr:M14 family metallocarboxypeptidase [Clostridia bacterium]
MFMQTQGYTYENLEQNIRWLKEKYPFIEVGIAGYSLLGRNLYIIKLGTGQNEVFYNAAHHALEWITTPVLMKFIEDFAEGYVTGKNLSRGYNPREIWESSTIYIMPMVNPDGVDLVINGLSEDNPYYNDLIKWNDGSTDFSTTWQANARGVDLNHNYNAGWEIYKEMETEIGITGPGPTRYAGTAPESEPETKTVADFTRNHNFRLVLAYHAQGEVIYWNFMNLNPPDGEYIGRALSVASGYSLETATGPAAYSGYDDWFTKEFNRPGYTIEVGKGKNPLPVSQFGEIYEDNLEMLLLAAII